MIDWANESHALAVHDAYLDGTLPYLVLGQPGDPPPLPAGYEVRARAISDQRIALAGERLAGLLESLAAQLPARGVSATR